MKMIEKLIKEDKSNKRISKVEDRKGIMKNLVMV
jgi:hypothetical protein